MVDLKRRTDLNKFVFFIMFGPLEKRRQKNKQCGRVCGAVFSTTPVVHKRARTNTHNCRSGASYGAMVRVVFVPIGGGKRESRRKWQTTCKWNCGKQELRSEPGNQSNACFWFNEFLASNRQKGGCGWTWGVQKAESNHIHLQLAHSEQLHFPARAPLALRCALSALHFYILARAFNEYLRYNVRHEHWFWWIQLYAGRTGRFKCNRSNGLGCRRVGKKVEEFNKRQIYSISWQKSNGSRTGWNGTGVSIVDVKLYLFI